MTHVLVCVFASSSGARTVHENFCRASRWPSLKLKAKLHAFQNYANRKLFICGIRSHPGKQATGLKIDTMVARIDPNICERPIHFFHTKRVNERTSKKRGFQ